MKQIKSVLNSGTDRQVMLPQFPLWSLHTASSFCLIGSNSARELVLVDSHQLNTDQLKEKSLKTKSSLCKFVLVAFIPLRSLARYHATGAHLCKFIGVLMDPKEIHQDVACSEQPQTGQPAGVIVQFPIRNQTSFCYID